MGKVMRDRSCQRAAAIAGFIGSRKRRTQRLRAPCSQRPALFPRRRFFHTACTIGLLCLGLFPLTGQASATTSIWQLLAEVRTGWGSELVIVKAPSIPNPAGCANADIAIAPVSATNRSEILSIALTALAAERNARLIIDNDDCEGIYPTLVAVYVQ